MRRMVFVLGRILLGLVFLITGVKKLLYWHMIEESLAMKISTLNMHFPEISFLNDMLYFVPLILGIATFFELTGAIILISGYFLRLGTIFLLIFLIPATILYHDFWYQIGDRRMLEASMFMKNVAIIGSLLLLSLNLQLKSQYKIIQRK